MENNENKQVETETTEQVHQTQTTLTESDVVKIIDNKLGEFLNKFNAQERNQPERDSTNEKESDEVKDYDW